MGVSARRKEIVDFMHEHHKKKGYLPMVQNVGHEMDMNYPNCNKLVKEARERKELELPLRNEPALDHESLSINELAVLSYSQLHQKRNNNERPTRQDIFLAFTTSGKQPPVDHVLRDLRKKLGNEEFHRWFRIR